MVFHPRDQDTVSGLQELLAKTGRNQVDRLCRTPGKDHLMSKGRIDIFSHLPASILIGICSQLAEVMDTTVYIAVDRIVIFIHRLQYGGGLLSSRGIVQVHQGMAV